MKYIHLNEVDSEACYARPGIRSLQTAGRFREGILLGIPGNSMKAM
jgi:hypothetical protein